MTSTNNRQRADSNSRFMRIVWHGNRSLATFYPNAVALRDGVRQAMEDSASTVAHGYDNRLRARIA